MLILAIDSATPVAGVALLDDHKVIAEHFVNYRKTHSETLMPTIDRLLGECQTRLDDLTAIAVTVGPGSFTGLRIGLAAAKGLCLAAAKPAVGISTLDVLAHNVFGSEALVCPLLDARKQEVYTAFYDVSDTYPRKLSAELACSPQEFTVLARETAEKHNKASLILLGDGYYPYEEYFLKELQDTLLAVPLPLMLPRASSLGSLALKRLAQGECDDPLTMTPTYLRLSEAENRLLKGEG